MRRALGALNWANLIAGMALGVIGYWLLSLAVENSSDRSSSILQLGLSVLLGGVVGWVIPQLINDIRTRWSELRPIRELLGSTCSNRDDTLIYMGSLYPKDSLSFLKAVPGTLDGRMEVTPKTSMPWVVVENDARALGYLMSVLASAGKTENLSVIRDDLGLEEVEVNMICIGSIKNNHMTAAVNSSFSGLPLRFTWLEEELAITDGKILWHTEEECDYALLVKVVNEYSPTHCVWICAGLSHFGTASAAYFLFSRWRELHAKFGGSNFGLLIKGRKNNFKYVDIVAEKRAESSISN
jgi:hypothetical protein